MKAEITGRRSYLGLGLDAMSVSESRESRESPRSRGHLRLYQDLISDETSME